MQSTIEIAREEIVISAEKALFWPAKKILVIADAHLGKAAHFRKNGIALPLAMVQKDLDRLQGLLDTFQPETVLFLGDLFHSQPNVEWNWFGDWLSRNTHVTFELVLGNHDRDLQQHEVHKMLQTSTEKEIGPFVFTHEPLEQPHATLYNICGHIHPGVRLSGKGGQHLRLPCFWFGEKQGILPAFGNLTGAVPLKGKAKIYAIAQNQLFTW